MHWDSTSYPKNMYNYYESIKNILKSTTTWLMGTMAYPKNMYNYTMSQLKTF
jgi:hypothetical protein